MSFEHKAFAFDYRSFIGELKPLLEKALAENDIDSLKSFIDENLPLLKDPYEGNSLDDSWEDMIEAKEVHQYGDFAITKYYDPAADIGLGYEWENIQKLLLKESPSLASNVLGFPIGIAPNYFDPGKMGSYFQTPELVKNNIEVLCKLLEEKGAEVSKLFPLFEMLKKIELDEGLYITF